MKVVRCAVGVHVLISGLVLLVVASADSVDKSNEFMDTLLIKLRESGAKLEGIPVADFNITVPPNRITNTVFKASLTNGVLNGLTKIARKGNCEPTRWTSGNITLECHLDLSQLSVAYATRAKGHSLLRGEGLMDVFVRVKRATAKFEAQSMPNKPPVIKTFIINDTLDSTVQALPDPELNPERRSRFDESLKEVAHQQIRVLVDTTLPKEFTAMASDLLLPPV